MEMENFSTVPQYRLASQDFRKIIVPREKNRGTGVSTLQDVSRVAKDFGNFSLGKFGGGVVTNRT